MVTGCEGSLCNMYIVVGSGVGENDVWCGGYIACYVCGEMWANVSDHAILYKLMYLSTFRVYVYVSKCVMIGIEVCYHVDRNISSKNGVEVWYGYVLACRRLIQC